MTKSRILKKYRYMECPYREHWRDLVTTDPHPIYNEVDYCRKGLYDHTGYTGYNHCNEGYEFGCLMCPHKIFRRKDMSAYLKQKKVDKKLLKESEKLWKKNPSGWQKDLDLIFDWL